jgi:hypothetical protein
MRRLIAPALGLVFALGLLLVVQLQAVETSPGPAPIDSTATLWLARGAWHETRPELEEAVEVMWAIRRRAELGYRGRVTIEGVLHDPAQFTGFHSSTAQRKLMRLTWSTNNTTWRQYLELAADVMRDSVQSRLADNCLHFLNPRLASPAWTTSNPKAVGRLEFHCGVN